MSQPLPLGQNAAYLKKDQYKDSSNLDARAELHRRFTVSQQEWMPWVFDQLNLREGDNILECGCGPAWLWRNNVERIPANCTLTLTDLSDGMVAEAEAALQGSPHNFHFQTANIETLSFDSDSFDIVVANHMLYHVPNLDAALAEVRRALKPNGHFYAATNGQNHMDELHQLGEKMMENRLAKEFGIRTSQFASAFKLENGHDLLAPHFQQIELHMYDSHLEVTDAQALLNYMLSSSKLREAVTPEAKQQTLTMINDTITAQGHFRITKETGIFVAH